MDTTVVYPSPSRDRVVEMTKAGWSIRRIAAELGVTESAVSQKRRRARDLDVLPACASPTSDRRDKVIALTKAGWTSREIAKEMGIKPASVAKTRNRARKMGLLPTWERSDG